MIKIYLLLPFPGVTDTEENVNPLHRDNQKNEWYQDQGLSFEFLKDLDEKIIDFIKPWFRKWKTQSMFQVLLLYRSTQERNLVYFCQQVHIYNQNSRSILESLNEEITLSEIDATSDFRELIPKKKISVHKTPFRLSELTLVNVSYKYGLVQEEKSNDSKANEELMDDYEEWDAPIKSLFMKEKPIQNTLNTHDKECQTYSFEDPIETTIQDDKNNSSKSQPKAEDLTNNIKPMKEEFEDFNLNEIEHENEEILNKINVSKEIRKPVKYIGLAPKRGTGVRETFDINHIDTSKNNKNNNQELPKYKSPIREMEEKFKTKQKSSSEDDDDPPFNFRAMLRKTNYTESAYHRHTDHVINTYDFTLKKLKKVEKPKNERVITLTELAPGLIIEGEIADL